MIVWLQNTIFALFFLFVGLTQAESPIKFDIQAQYPHSAQKKCLSMWMAQGSQVAAHFSSPYANGQKVNFEIFDLSPNSNQYGTKNDFSDHKLVFTPQDNTDVYFCFWNVLDDGLVPSPSYVRQVGLEVQVGKTDEEYKKLAKAEKLKPKEMVLKRLEERFNRVVETMDIFKSRDLDKLSTHESSKARVANFSFFSIGVLLVVGVWQIVYLRNYFKTKKLI